MFIYNKFYAPVCVNLTEQMLVYIKTHSILHQYSQKEVIYNTIYISFFVSIHIFLYKNPKIDLTKLWDCNTIVTVY